MEQGVGAIAACQKIAESWGPIRASPATRRLSLGFYQFPLYGEAEFIDCVRRVRVELHLKHELAVLVAAKWTGVRIPSYHLAPR